MKKATARERQLEYWKSLPKPGDKSSQVAKDKESVGVLPSYPLKETTNTPKTAKKIASVKSKVNTPKQNNYNAVIDDKEEFICAADDLKCTEKVATIVSTEFEELKEFLADKLQRLSHFQEEINKGLLVDIYCNDASELLKEIVETVCLKCDAIEDKLQQVNQVIQRNEELETALSLTLRENKLLHEAVAKLSE